jgi:SEC-C motif domain protein
LVNISVCPCRVREEGTQSYNDCCQPWHVGFDEGIHAPTPETLMRSRYSAYALAKKNDAQGHAMLRYLLATWHVSTTPGEMELSPTQWIGVDVINAQGTDEVGLVEFKAFFKVDGKAQAMHELSRFVRIEGAWKYIDGEHTD